MPEKLTLGSLFDGSGGFPLAGKIAGITPIWASEIEPFSVRVTTKRIPEMKHYGDVRKMDGAKIEPVDIVTFGSPCQDLSIAGHREGLDGGRSGLFYEAIRIIEEMRRATNGEYPKYAVWENVTGAFSSNGGEDFRAVLESFCSIKQRVSISRPERWTPAGEIVGSEFSLAWRTLDAQFWGVPQHRERVFLVADFRDDRAGEVLFERKNVSRHSGKSLKIWASATKHSEKDIRAPRKILNKLNIYGIGKHGNPGILYQQASTLTACGAGMVCDKRGLVRCLTPLESCRLQGFPDYWCDDLGTENPTAAELEFWNDVFKTAGKKKSENQLRKWLKNPRSDAAEYKMWGNGIALPCAVFVLWSIANTELIKMSVNVS